MSDTIREKTLCAIDIGTSKVVALLAELNDNEEINMGQKGFSFPEAGWVVSLCIHDTKVRNQV